MIRKDIAKFLKELPEGITLVVASKYIDVDDMSILKENGVTNFGENRVDSFIRKQQALLNSSIKWHFIGHLQTNKAKNIINEIDCLHSLDSLKLAKLINTHRYQPLDCFVEVSINNEANKNGVPLQQLDTFVEEVIKLPNINLVGFMMMAIKDSDESSLRMQFHNLKIEKERIEKKYQIKLPYLSMGMSDDYQIAIQEGATHIRLGRILFE